jgi:hypothetical protein
MKPRERKGQFRQKVCTEWDVMFHGLPNNLKMNDGMIVRSIVFLWKDFILKLTHSFIQ